MLKLCACMLCTQGLQDTTKARDGLQRVPLMKGIGNAVFVNDISQVGLSILAVKVSLWHASKLSAMG